jgi:hypothetical protein
VLLVASRPLSLACAACPSLAGRSCFGLQEDAPQPATGGAPICAHVPALRPGRCLYGCTLVALLRAAGGAGSEEAAVGGV